MFEESGYIYSAQCSKLQSLATRCDVRIEQSMANIDRYNKLTQDIGSYRALADTLGNVMAMIKPWYEDIEDYNAQRKKDALMAVNSVISMASKIVPSCAEGIRFRIEGKEAWLETLGGVELDDAEGSGLKGVLSAYMSMVIANANPTIIPFFLLDEPLAKLSAENSVTASAYIDLFTDNAQIIWIEQKLEVFAQVANKIVYTFFKGDNGFTKVIREEPVSRADS